MNKELKALDSIMVSLAEYKEYAIDKLPTKAKKIREENDDDFLIIETALKRLEEHDKIFKKYDIKDIWLEPALYVIKNHFPMDTETQLKKLKALEIVKEKTTSACNCLMILKARFDNLDYNNYKELFLTDLTQEEYELLKEVLL